MTKLPRLKSLSESTSHSGRRYPLWECW